MNVTIDEIILLAGGTFLIVWGIGKIVERNKLVKTGIKVKGIVLRFERRSDASLSSYYHPVIKYVTVGDNEEITKAYAIGSNPPMYDEGETLKIIYDKTDKRHFIIDGTANKITGPLLLLIGVGLIIAVAVYYMLHQY
ncbi:DUF3592 domain-containing protein [Mucilaginibacter flavus]|uniref:DUF3592 domain-containing protein n=1 Tax=Mucilaginibacter flavus TaxID=931504 RepID=UPI0025B3547A|nr:DUF3592 domain-containing protein [Mucilaginibacter flavus]MDN3582644.1 DUF3592 domain-containing protein [Mucilaginibacter flavus]